MWCLTNVLVTFGTFGTITFLVEQQVYLWVGYVLLLWVDFTLHFLEMVVQLVPQGIELPSSGLVVLMVMGVVDSDGFGYCLSLALTSFFARLSVLLRLRHGLGTFLISSSLGWRISLSDLVGRSGV